jgi:flagellar assembly factor FliW
MSMSMLEVSPATILPVRPWEPTPTEASLQVRFPQGLPGFPAATRFRLEPLAAEAGLLRLSSMDDPELRFLLLAHVDGRLPLDRVDLDAACAMLGMVAADTAVLLVVTAQILPGSPRRQFFVNLRAPIFLDTTQHAAVQHVLPHPSYPVRYPLGA